ncbi:MAG: hypothetical protein CL943_03945 [Candidatus Diapherotrites archaeon]|uniref:Peptidase M10 metallopeptidase domain-containing protein n=1 Tax=Candidatus Iainarchaeum sp. TaxID=3101447 RepID=A0A2D6M1Y5_9ARCH|nr:hypothetical protein [Candidatus Diapherotrites archaeon]|tara:strand:+ start:56 stop:955 length:900 start_codon:yes stop_codon:yes gene_type:complete
MKKYLFLLVFSALVFSVLVLALKPDFQAVEIRNPVTSDVKNGVVIPAKAVEVTPNIFYLGATTDEGRVVEGYAIVTPKKAKAKGTCNNNNVCEPELGEKNNCSDCSGGGTNTGESTCYGFLAKGAKWKTTEPYVVNPSNTSGLNEAFVASNLDTDIAKWENAAGTNIIGAGSVTSDLLVADMVATDGKNEVYFGSISDSGAIAITIVWGIFRGPPGQRELVEWDQVYDQVDFNWSSSGEAGKMDFENIATHELGHSVGLGDLYTVECLEETMYGYASEGETKKRTLESGDITGIQELYN